MSAYLSGAIAVVITIAAVILAALGGHKRAREALARAEEEVGRILREARQDAEIVPPVSPTPQLTERSDP